MKKIYSFFALMLLACVSMWAVSAVVSRSEDPEPGTGDGTGSDPMANVQTVVVDELTVESMGLDASSNSYKNYTVEDMPSGAVYVANCMVEQKQKTAIQLRSKNNSSGIVTTVSGGNAAYVTVEWDAATDPARKLQVYGKNEPYTNPTDLYNEATAGTKIGDISASEDTPNDLAITDEYKYIGIRSESGALYAKSIEIIWLQEAPLILDNFVALCDIPVGTEVVMNAKTTVVVAGEMIALLYDGTSYYGAQLGAEVAAGDEIAAGWSAEVTEWGLMATTDVEVAGKAEVPAAMPVDEENLANAYYAWNYVTLENVYLAQGIDEGLTTAEFVGGVQEIYVYNILGIDDVEAGTYNVTGFFMEMPAVGVMDEEEEGTPGTGSDTNDDMGVNTPTVVFVPVSVEVAPVKIDNFVALCDFEAGATVVVDTKTTVVVAGDMITLLYDGTSYYGAQLGAEVAAGDEIAAGWSAEVTEWGLMATTDVEVAGKAEVPAAMPVDEENLANAYYNWNYVTLENVYLAQGIDDGLTTAEFVGGVQEIYVYNILGIDDVEAGTYNVTGFFMEMPAVGVMDEEEEGTPGTGSDTNDDMGVNTPTVVFVPVSVEEVVPVIDNFNALYDLEEGQAFIMGCDLTVIVAGNSISLVSDGTDSFYGLGATGLDLKAGDIIGKGFKATVQMSAICADEDATLEVVGTTDELPEPYELEEGMAQWFAFPYTYVQMLNVELLDELGDGFDAAGAAQGNFAFSIIDMNGIAEDTVYEPGSYNITGFWMPINQGIEPMDDVEDDMEVNTTDLVFVPVALEEAMQLPVIEDFNALTDVPEDVLFQVGMETTVVFCEDGLALLYDGVQYWLAVVDQELEAGDVISPDWVAMLNRGMLVLMDEVYVERTTTVPEPMTVTSENLAESIVNYNYVTLEGLQVPDGVESEDVFKTTIKGGAEVTVADFMVILGSVEEGGYFATGFWMDINPIMGAEEDADPVYVFVPVKFVYDPESAIVGIESANGEAVYYNINGQRVAQPKNGEVYIRVVNGKAVKTVK